ncbi:hypothetical protein ACS5PJ_08285 [Pseudarthrobacter sp. YS3]|uniref:hypothetical protein n=1 Tax=Pseudarthrobacter sp. YS3 TaxID=3453718 RepID=UPI003EEC068D
MAIKKSAHLAPGAAPGGAAVHSGAAAVAYRRAWWALALYPVAFGAAFAVGEGILSLVTEGSGNAGFWQVLAAGIPALLVFVIPGILAVSQGRKAMRLGRKDGRVLALVGAGIAIGFVVLNVASYLIGQAAG